MTKKFINKFVATAAGIAGFLGLSTNISQAQMIGTDIFLQGNTVEVGICNIGAFGTCSAPPSGYHARPTHSLGFVADPAGDGWTVGTPTYMGDYFIPGSPHEGWDIMIGTQWNRAWGQCGNFTTASGPLTLTGGNVSYEVVGNRKIGNWEGSMGDLAITHRTILDTTKTFFVIEVTLENTGTSTISNIYYDRTVDPDNEVYATGTGTGSFSTTNTIEYQPTDEDMTCLVTAIGPAYPSMSYLGLGAKDCRAKSYILSSGLSPYTPINQIFNGTTTHYVDSGDVQTGDVGIGIIFNVGNLEPGEMTSLAYAYILKESDLDSAFMVLGAGWEVEGSILSTDDTIEVCRGKELEININGGGAYVWGEWTPNIGLANPSGRNNVVTVQNEVITYTVIGTTTICPQSDTLRLTIIPIGDTVTVNEEICAGSLYDFNGDVLYASGTYFQTYSTIEGCDSIVKLNLTVNPLPGVDIRVDNSNICEGDNALFQVGDPTPNTTYQWLRDGAIIPGANGTSYIATEAGVYRVVGVTNKGCADTSRGVTLAINPAAVVNINDVELGNICIGDTIELSVDAQPGHEYYWSPDKAFRYITGSRLPTVRGIMLESENHIEVLAVNEYGCKATDQMVIYAVPCCDVYLPTAFTPNGDGLNDYFNIILQPGQKLVSFQIFDRTGKMVYDNNDRVNGWNGRITNTGDEVAQAVYFYRIVYSCTDGRNYEAKGDITVVR